MIRYGTSKDIEQVNIIRKEVSDLHATGEPQNFKPEFSEEIADYVKQFIGCNNKKLLVCEVENKICAYAMIELVTKPETVYRYEQKFIEIQELGTLQSEQGKGFGKLIINRIKEIAKEEGFIKIELNVWSFNEKALHFYEKMGFETYRRYLKLDI